MRDSCRLKKMIRDPDRPLRLGYVSSGFREHPNARFQELILANHDRERFEVFCYVDEPNPDAITDRLRGLCDRWVDITGLTDEALADRVREDRIDVLVDLTGHDHGNRLLVFARRPAPVQATYNGYIDTTGMSSMGYRITDALHDPPGLTDRFHTEKLVRLPICNWCYRGDEDCAAGSAAACAVQRQRHHLREPEQAGEGIPGRRGAVGPGAGGRARLPPAAHGHWRGSQPLGADALVKWGIPSNRLTLVPQAPTRADYLRRFAEIDICLDPFPFNGITTTCDALWMGVPVVTLAGRTHVSRAGVSLLSAIGLAKLIAQTPERYVQIAAALASDLPRLTRDSSRDAGAFPQLAAARRPPRSACFGVGVSGDVATMVDQGPERDMKRPVNRHPRRQCFGASGHARYRTLDLTTPPRLWRERRDGSSPRRRS